MPAKFALFFSMFYWAISPLIASVSIEQNIVTYVIESPDQVSKNVFLPFKVSGSNITEVTAKSDCGCAFVQVEKLRFSPGESGDLYVSLSLSGMQGIQRTTAGLTWKTATDSGKTTVQIVLKTPVVYRVSGDQLIWRSGDGSERIAEITFLDNAKSAITSNTTITDKNFTVRIIDNDNGKCRVGITPINKNIHVYMDVVIPVTTTTARITSIPLKCLISE